MWIPGIILWGFRGEVRSAQSMAHDVMLIRKTGEKFGSADKNVVLAGRPSKTRQSELRTNMAQMSPPPW